MNFSFRELAFRFFPLESGDADCPLFQSWDQNSEVIIDKGRLEHNGIPLLKSRTRIRRNLAIQLWGNPLTAR